MIKNLSQKEKNVVSGGGKIIFNVGADRLIKLTGTQNGMEFNMIIHSTYVTNLKGKKIFSGTQGSFCHNGHRFIVTPHKTGGILKYSRSWNPETDGITVQYSGSC